MTIRPGAKFGHLIVLRGNDDTAVCACICQRTCRVSAEELETGAITSCGCRPPTESMRASFYAARDERTRASEFRRMWNGRR